MFPWAFTSFDIINAIWIDTGLNYIAEVYQFLFIHKKIFPDIINDLFAVLFYNYCLFTFYQTAVKLLKKINQLTQKLKRNFPSVIFTPKALKIKCRRLFPFL